ncbi:ABC-type glycerol-3-phosphate transport system substrate-binding protein [Hydrogenispora ethanolica]|jgi:multiple sugar transport system substrate-binding protein|uniref:ABC-type glycerol-3-phosphate transport system substrate-binding protein n=1 Tax=Hydrogenispora ethanolica TaxID=1082276 RepID=A0A4R1S4L5_HYDET|nr:extracellular solute-binding protein [Hydrogenispora ethanolica]TCL74151.1 ABC-type glycerol-3-phosphate transport system substrate-binding protein [Hydrogenispora ethanolica]
MRRRISLFLSLVLAVCLLWSVTGLAKQSGNQISANLRILYPGTSEVEKAWAESLKKAVSQKYPNIKIEYIFLNWSDIEKKLAVMVASGDYPDMMNVQDVINPVAMNALEPLDEYLKKSSIKISDYSPAYLEYSKVNGKLYSIPLLGIVYAHIINTDLLKSAGYKMSDLKSWDAVKAAVKAMSKNGKYGYAMANGGTGRFSFRDFMMLCLSNDVTPDDISDASKAKYIEVLKLVGDLSPYMPKSQITWLYPELYKAWGAGSVGMMHTGTYFTANAISHSTEIIGKTRAFVFPHGPSASKPRAMVANAGFAMIKGSKQKEAAWKVMEVLNSKQLAARLGGAINLPASTKADKKVLNEVAKQTYPQSYQGHLTVLKDFSEIAKKYGVPQPRIYGQPQMELVVQGALVRLTNGELTPAAAYDEIRKGIQRVKDELK